MKLLIRFALLAIICASPIRDATGLRRNSINETDEDISRVPDLQDEQISEKEVSFVDPVELDPETPCSICTG
jgi:hypothetical protein